MYAKTTIAGDARYEFHDGTYDLYIEPSNDEIRSLSNTRKIIDSFARCRLHSLIIGIHKATKKTTVAIPISEKGQDKNNGTRLCPEK